MVASTDTTTPVTRQSIDIQRAAATLLLIGAPVLAVLVDALWLRMAALLLIGWVLPGLWLARHWRLPQATRPGFYLAAWGLGLCWLIGGALLAHYLPGPLAAWQLWGVFALGGLTLTLWRGPDHASDVEPLHATSRAIWIGGGALLLAAMLLRLPGLGYHEFHTDEVVLLRQASLSIEGHLTALAEHTKGPGEIAITLAVYRALGAIDETTARLPFALMSIGSVMATAWLGYRMLSGIVGLWAGILLLGNGFALGLSRIAQYQPGILLLSALAVWAMWEFARRGQPRWLSLAGVFSAFGMVLHYEFGLLAPALLLLAFLGWRKNQERLRLWKAAFATALPGALLLALAYVPPLFNPYFETTQSYLSNRLGETLVFNFPFFVEMGTFYNSTYFFFGLMGLTLLGTWLGWRTPGQLHWRATLVLTAWWLPFFVLYIFVVRYPGTHFYQMMTAWSLLAAIPLAALTRALRTRASITSGRALLLYAASALVAVWLAVSVFYLYLLFFRQQPEYLVNHEQQGLPLYWAPYPVPQKPRFGFPIHSGWKTIGVLSEWGYFTGSYSSNDRSWGLRNWYRAPLRWIEQFDGDEAPDYIFTARHIQEENLFYHDGYHDTYHRIGEVRFRDEPRIELWARAPLPAPYVTFHAEDFSGLFLDEIGRLHPPDAPSLEPADPLLGSEVALLTAHVPSTQWRQGETIHLRFVWQAQAPLTVDYKLFVHVADAEGRPVAQWDGYPGLNTSRTSAWPVDEPFTDHVLLSIPPDTPPGMYTLLVGLYNPESGARLGDRALAVTGITVQRPSLRLITVQRPSLRLITVQRPSLRMITVQ